MFEKLKKGHEVETIIIENGGRTLRMGGRLRLYGGHIYDSYSGETYPVITRPLLAYRGKKSIPVYLIDHDAGVTVQLETTGEGGGSERIDIPEDAEITIDGNRYAGVTCELVRSEAVAKLSTDPQLISRVLSSHILADQFGAPLAGREKILFLLAGMVLCFLIMQMFG